MSANNFDYSLRQRELVFDAWWDNAANLPAWLGTASGSVVGSLPAGMTLTASGLQNGHGYYQLNATGSEAVNASGRVVVANLLSYIAKEITFELDGVVTSENRGGSDESPFVTQCDYLFFLNGGGFGVILEHSSAVGGTQIRVIENSVTRIVSTNGLDLCRFNMGSMLKNIGLQIRNIGNGDAEFKLLTGGEEQLTIPLSFGNQTANHAVRAAFGITRVSGADPQYLRFEKVRLNVKR